MNKLIHLDSMIKVLFLIGFALILNGCEGSSGGTTTEAPAPTVPTPPVTPTTSVFNSVNSSFVLLNSSNVEITSAGVGESIKLKLTAKDQDGKLMTGLSIKFARINTITPDIVASEISSGVYQAVISVNDQVYEEFTVLKDSASVNLNKNIFISFCAGTSSPSASPFHNSVVMSSETFYIICNASQLSQASSFLTRNYILGNTIDLASFYVDVNLDGIPDNQFKIGNTATGYSGKFKGYGLLIRNFKYKNSTESDVGFFGKLSSGANISSLVLDSPQVSGLNNVGGFAGSIQAAAGIISINSVSLLSAQNLSKSGNYHGGIIGIANGLGANVTISNCSFSGSINLNLSLSTRSNIGGIFGGVVKVNLTQNYFDSLITFTDKSQIISNIGGVAGTLEQVIYSGNSVNSAMVLNSGKDVGGIAGISDSLSLSNSYTNTINLDVTGTSLNDFKHLGGMFGQLNNSSVSTMTGFLNTVGVIKDSFGGISNMVFNSNINQSILNGSFSFDANGVGGMYSIVENSTLIKNWNYAYVESLASNQNIGGIVSVLKNSVLSTSTFEGTLNTPQSSLIGGLVAMTEETSLIENSSFKGVLNANQYAAGLLYDSVGVTPKVIISNSYSSGDINVNNFASGLVYNLISDSEINNSFVSSKIRDYLDVSLVNGYSISSNKSSLSSIVNNVYYLSSRTGVNTCGINSCVGTDAPDISHFYSTTNSPMNLWNFSTVWQIFGGYPILRY